MPKPRTKRQVIRDERKLKRRAEQEGWDPDTHTSSKRRRRNDGDDVGDAGHEGGDVDASNNGSGPGEKEFFGMLDEEEQELFRHMDDDLETDDFENDEERRQFLSKVFEHAKGKELKLASSQSCSRFMEKLIQRADAEQKKQLFEAFGNHFLSLVQHRFASHCCEALFLQAAPVVTQELAGFEPFVIDNQGGQVDATARSASSMEDLFLATLDELEGNLSYLITDRFASHCLRILLLVLSGRPLDDVAFQRLAKSRKKENVAVSSHQPDGASQQQSQGLRAVPSSFTNAVKKIIADATIGMDRTSLEVLAKHPIGNPTLQLMLQIDMSLNKTPPKDDAESSTPTLLQQLLPQAPQSLSDETSEASQFINGMVYDPIGSRIVELILSECPGKIFKALNLNMFLPRIQGYVRNDVASYAAIKALNRMGKDDLKQAVDQILPSVPQLVGKARFNVIKTLFQRCDARGANDQIRELMKGLREGCGGQTEDLIPALCRLDADYTKKQKKKRKDNGEDTNSTSADLTRNEAAISSHGAQLLSALLAIQGPSKGVQAALLAQTPSQLCALATHSTATATLLTTALTTPTPHDPSFHKSLVTSLTPHMFSDLCASTYGHHLVNAVCTVPTRGKVVGSVPMHMKEAIMEQQLAPHEAELRESWMGRSVWRTWRGDLWRRRRGEWKTWMKEMEPPVATHGSGANAVTAADGERSKLRGRGKVSGKGAGAQNT